MSPTPSEHPSDVHALIQPWIQAARPAAHPMIFIPLFIGQAMAFHVHRQLGLAYFLYTLLFGVLYQVYLLYVNDHADEAIDRTNEQYWLSGGSRVLPQDKLRPSDLLTGATTALVLMLGLTVFVGVFADRPWLSVGAALAVVLCWAYNRRPLRMSYQGHGEILQGLGCGVLLPIIGFYMQHGSLRELPWGALIPLYLIFHAGNIVTALPDYRSDKEGEKKTYPVRHGELCARTTVLVLLAVAHVSIIVANLQLPTMTLAIIAIPSALILAGIAASGILRKADVSDFPLCKTFVTLVSASQAWLLCAWTGALLMEGTA